MCDKPSFKKLEDRVSQLEKTDVVHDVKISSLTSAVRVQSYTIWAAFFMVLLALIYGALGPKGFSAVRDASSVCKGK